ncbi:hypothetical protein OF83DRAFT_1177096 [Amylostereum chailletii]|nr:hypothetical protein OF83DRAFT_1177096 [Amylostereum chailletii]
MGESSSYELVAQDDGSEDMIEGSEKNSTRKSESSYTRWTARVVTICTILNTILLLYLIFGRPPTPPSIVRRSDLWRLPSRSSYIDFDILYRNRSFSRTKHDPLINHAGTPFARVSSVYAGRVYPIQSTYKLIDEGHALVDERRLHVTPEFSTIAQFRVLDWGMERCSVKIVVPSRSSSATKVNLLKGDPAILDVWLLDGDAEVDLTKLSGATKPRRKRRLGQLSVSYNVTDETNSFPCTSMSVQTLEIACAGSPGPCGVDIVHTGFGTEGESCF